MRLRIFTSCFTPINLSWLNVHCAQHRDIGVINSHWIHFLRTLMAKTEVINCKTKHVVNNVWFLVLKDRLAARHVSYTRYFTNNRFSERSSFTLWIPLAQVQVLSELPNWLLTSSSAEVCFQDGDVVTVHLQGSRACFKLKQKSGCVDAAPVWEWATYNYSLLLPLLLLSFSLQSEPIFAFELNSDLVVIVRIILRKVIVTLKGCRSYHLPFFYFQQIPNFETLKIYFLLLWPIIDRIWRIPKLVDWVRVCSGP